jgi:hypothetical protein
MSKQGNNRGGKREGSGRKKKDPTKTVRVSIKLWDLFKEWLKTNS